MAPGQWCRWLCSFFYPNRQLAQQSATMAETILLEKLPVEIIDHVLQNLPKDSLANLRLASRFFQERATPSLYRQFTLRYTVGSIAKARRIFNSPYLAGLVREFRFDTSINEIFSTMVG